MLSHLTRDREREFKNSKWREVNNLMRITMTRDSDGNIIDLSGIKLKKWLVNVSKHNLTDDQTWVIIKGLNFAVPPDKLPVEEFIVATEQACRFLPITKSEQLRSQVAGIMKTAKLPKPNINRKERQALAELKKRKKYDSASRQGKSNSGYEY